MTGKIVALNRRVHLSYEVMLFGLLSAIMLLQFPLNLLRLSGVSTTLYFEGILVLLGIVALFRITYVIANNRIPQFAIIYTLFIIYIVIVGLARGNLDVLSGLRYFLLALVMYFVLDRTALVWRLYKSTTLWMCVLAVHILGLVYYYVALKGTVYPGIGVQSIGYAALFFTFSGHPLAAVCAAVVIVLEGKRSIMVSYVLAMVGGWFIGSRVRNIFGRVVVGFVAAVAVLFGVLMILGMYGADSPMINRINLANPFAPQFDLFLGSSGRAGEIASLIAVTNEWALIFGHGSAFTYIWDVGYERADPEEVKGYLHLSMLNYVVVGGVVGAGLWFYILTAIFNRIKRLTRGFDNVSVPVTFLVFSIVQSFFGFNTAVDPFFWAFVLAPFFARHLTNGASEVAIGSESSRAGLRLT